MAKEVGFGIIGCGIISGIHIAQIQASPQARLRAVADIDEAKARTGGEAAGVDWYTDYRLLLQRDDIDVINLLTPSGMHGDMAIEAARAGKHVIVEKPMDITIERARRMVDGCRQAGVKLSVISQHRFDSSTVRVKQDLEAGKLGRPLLGLASVNWYRSQAYYDSAGWRGTWTLDGGGALMNQSIHTIDLLQYLMGPVASVYAYTAMLAHERLEVEDVAVATVKFRSGSLGTIVGTTSAYPGFSARLEIFAENGSVVIDNDLLVAYYLKDRPGEDGEPRNLAGQAVQQGTGAAEPAAIEGASHGKQIRDMIAAIQEGREPLVDGEEGLKPLQVILAIYESARSGKPVLIKP